jgi:hypothetical protein
MHRFYPNSSYPIKELLPYVDANLHIISKKSTETNLNPIYKPTYANLKYDENGGEYTFYNYMN